MSSAFRVTIIWLSELPPWKRILSPGTHASLPNSTTGSWQIYVFPLPEGPGCGSGFTGLSHEAIRALKIAIKKILFI